MKDDDNQPRANEPKRQDRGWPKAAKRPKEQSAAPPERDSRGRYTKGHSGNRKGRPPAKPTRFSPFRFGDEYVTIEINGKKTQKTRYELVLNKTFQQALAKDSLDGLKTLLKHFDKVEMAKAEAMKYRQDLEDKRDELLREGKRIPTKLLRDIHEVNEYFREYEEATQPKPRRRR